jgi:hypothetical protein
MSMAKKKVGGTSVVDGVAIPAVGGGKTGMPFEGNLSGGSNANAVGKSAVEGLGPAMGGDGTAGIEMGHLGSGMDPAVGAAGGDDPHRAMGIQCGDGILQGGLNAALVGLPLPTMEAGAQVLQTESDATQLGGHRPPGWIQTSSMMAISALSPRRRTVRMMRV